MGKGAPITILLIDDDQDDRDFFCMAVDESSFNITCHVTKGAKEALTKLKEGKINPDYIFLDLNMPEIDGRSCLKSLKSDSTTQNTPVVIFTTSSEKQDIEETKTMGAVDFITKAPDISELRIQIDNFLTTQQ